MKPIKAELLTGILKDATVYYRHEPSTALKGPCIATRHWILCRPTGAAAAEAWMKLRAQVFQHAGILERADVIRSFGWRYHLREFIPEPQLGNLDACIPPWSGELLHSYKLTATLNDEASIVSLAWEQGGHRYVFQPGYLLPILRVGLRVGMPTNNNTAFCVCPLIEQIAPTQAQVVGVLVGLKESTHV
jgi:hypothetical protein